MPLSHIDTQLVRKATYVKSSEHSQQWYVFHGSAQASIGFNAAPVTTSQLFQRLHQSAQVLQLAWLQSHVLQKQWVLHATARAAPIQLPVGLPPRLTKASHVKLTKDLAIEC